MDETTKILEERMANLHANPDAVVLIYPRSLEEALVITIRDLPSGNYHLDIEAIGDPSIPSVKGALELELHRTLEEPPKYRLNPGRIGLIRIPRAYAVRVLPE